MCHMRCHMPHHDAMRGRPAGRRPPRPAQCQMAADALPDAVETAADASRRPPCCRRLAQLHHQLRGVRHRGGGTVRRQPTVAPPGDPSASPSPEHTLSFHLQHPGGESTPGDPNAAYFLDGTYHLHYILQHPWQGGNSFSFVHCTSPDMLHWSWQTTKLQPAFTGHGMFSGTGFITKEGRPAVIYHGQASGANQIAIAKDRQLSAWEKPYPVVVVDAAGKELTGEDMRMWDPDCWLVGETYYALSGGENPQLLKSADLRLWTHVGDMLSHDLPDVAIGEDISCANFFEIAPGKWMLLCIAHHQGCRYYIGTWDADAEQFVPEQHGRMNWRREAEQAIFGMGDAWRVDCFAPESVLTPDGRRVMWAWCASLGRDDHQMDRRTVQSLPRELSLSGEDGTLRIRPLRELESLRRDHTALRDISIDRLTTEVFGEGAPPGSVIAALPGTAVEIRITVAREQAHRKLFGFSLFSDGHGGGLPLVLRPETGGLRLGTAEAPFVPGQSGEDLELRIFIDQHMVEVFANSRQVRQDELLN
jgi:beta-fructofuranosidase